MFSARWTYRRTMQASLDTRAHTYEALGRREDAIAGYKRVLALLPENMRRFSQHKRRWSGSAPRLNE